MALSHQPPLPMFFSLRSNLPNTINNSRIAAIGEAASLARKQQKNPYLPLKTSSISLVLSRSLLIVSYGLVIVVIRRCYPSLRGPRRGCGGTHRSPHIRCCSVLVRIQRCYGGRRCPDRLVATTSLPPRASSAPALLLLLLLLLRSLLRSGRYFCTVCRY